MKNKGLSIGIILLAVSIFTSCYEDKGHYDYDWVPEVKVSFDFTEKVVQGGSRLYVEPRLQQLLKNEDGDLDSLDLTESDRYRFVWSGWDAAKNEQYICSGPVLDTVILLPIKDNPYTVVCKVTDKISGVSWQGSFKLRVINLYSKGFAFMTEDATGGVDIEIYGEEADGKKSLQKNVLRQTGFPYQQGGANFIAYHSLKERERIWVSTGEGMGWLDKSSFSWNDKQLDKVIMMEKQADGYTYTNLVTAGEQCYFFFGNDGSVSLLNTYMVIFAPFNTLPPYVSPSGQYQTIEVSPFAAGVYNNIIMWDNTNKRFVKYQGNSLSLDLIYLTNVAEEQAFSGWEMVYMKELTYRRFDALMKNPQGKFTYLPFSYTSDWEVMSNYITTWEDPNGLLERAEHRLFTHNQSFFYFSVGNQLYVYREGEGCKAVDIGVTFDRITCITDEPNVEKYANDFMVATYDETKGGKVYVLSPDSLEPLNVNVKEVITGLGHVKSMTYFY